MKFLMCIAALFAIALGDAHKPPPICMSAPSIPLSPGSVVAARLVSPAGKRCEGTLTFSNTDFFPVRFSLRPLRCMGTQVAEFTVPPEVPNGEAHILWRCADSLSICTLATITGGLSDANAINFSQSGSVSCIVPVETRTTLATSVGVSATEIKEIKTTILSTGTAEAISTFRASKTDISLTSTGGLPTTIDGSSTRMQTSLSTLLSTSTSTSASAVKPTPFTTLVPVATETITTVSKGLSTDVTNTITTTIFSTVISERLPAQKTSGNPAGPSVTHTCAPTA